LPLSATTRGAFVHPHHSGKCLQVDEASTKNGARVSQWDCLHQDNVRWTLEAAGDGAYFVKAKHSGKCLQVSGASRENGAPITQWDCVNQDNVKWTLEPV